MPPQVHQQPPVASLDGGEVSSARRVELVDNDDDEEGPVLLDGGRLATDCADKFRDS